jgi:hypothetical protein
VEFGSDAPQLISGLLVGSLQAADACGLCGSEYEVLKSPFLLQCVGMKSSVLTLLEKIFIPSRLAIEPAFVHICYLYLLAPSGQGGRECKDVPSRLGP